VLVRKEGPDRLRYSTLVVPAAKSIPDYVALENSWKTNEFEPIFALSKDSLSSRISELPIRPGASNVSDSMIDLFQVSLLNTLMSFKAERFSEYLKWATIDGSYSYDSNIITAFGEMISVKNANKPLDPQVVAAAWWRTNAVDGTWASNICKGICWKKCFIQIKLFQEKVALDPRTFNSSLMDSVPNCGVVCTTSFFKYSPSPEDIFLSSQSIYFADAYLLFEFTLDSETTAAPLILRYYWEPTSHKWLPYLIAWGYQGTVPRPIF
jgi:hypothetical protein